MPRQSQSVIWRAIASWSGFEGDAGLASHCSPAFRTRPIAAFGQYPITASRPSPRWLRMGRAIMSLIAAKKCPRAPAVAMVPFAASASPGV
ncbi:hypothetical protein D9M72_643580 [compost metagenome]